MAANYTGRTNRSLPLLEAAKKYAETGVPVFPCKPVRFGADAKKPFTKNGFNDASPAPEQIEKWWRRFPDAFIGMPTGEASGFDVLDLDTKEGRRALECVPEWEGLSPLVIRTISGGFHVYFKADGVRSTQGVFGKESGVDIRGEGGYVIAPGSDGYTILRGSLDDDLPTMPERFRTRQAAPAKRASSTDDWPEWLVALCKRDEFKDLAGLGTSQNPDDLPPPHEEVLRALEACDPDLPEDEWSQVSSAAFNCGLTFEEFHDWCATANVKYTGEKDVAAKWNRKTQRDCGYGTLVHFADKHSPGWRNASNVVNVDEYRAAKTLLISGTDFVQGFVPPEYLIDGIIRRSFLYSMTAPTGGGKTAIALTIMAHVATGRPLVDRPVEKGKALFFAGENVEDVQARWIGLCETWGDDLTDVVFMPSIEKLSCPKFRAQFVKEVEAFGEFSLVVVDTSAAYSEAEEENSNTEGGAHARVLRSLIDLVPGRPTVIALCHPTKAANMDNLLPRGAGAFIAEVDGNLVCKLSTEYIEVHWHGKFRGIEFAPVYFTLDTVLSDRLKDTKGRIIPTVVSRAITDEECANLHQDALANYTAVLAVLRDEPDLSSAKVAEKLRWVTPSGKVNKSRSYRTIIDLERKGYIKREDGDTSYEITAKGKRLLTASTGDAAM